MNASVVIIAHNEGRNLQRTVASTIDSFQDPNFEIVVVDDASTDRSVDSVRAYGERVRVVAQRERSGVSPSRVEGAKIAHGDVLIFLDAHCRPEAGALDLLIADVRRTRDQAVITPAICHLDDLSWENHRSWTGHGYRLHLETLRTSWLSLDRLRRATDFYESPNAIGCAVAVSRKLYDALGGFDPDMKMWGAEDADFGLTTWLLGYSVLHDPRAVVGHRFQPSFQAYDVPRPHVVANEIRLARRHFSEEPWRDWLMRAGGRVPPACWDESWSTFERNRDSVEADRERLFSTRVRDEFWYARHFGLTWPLRFSFGEVPGETTSSGDFERLGAVVEGTARSGTVFARIRLSVQRDQQGTLYIDRAAFGSCNQSDMRAYQWQVATSLTGCNLEDLRSLTPDELLPMGELMPIIRDCSTATYEAIQSAISQI